MDQGNYRKRYSQQKWTGSEYHVQDRKYVSHKYVNMPHTTNQLPVFPFCGMHMKPHGVIGLSKYYHLKLEPKLVHDNCSISRILCAFAAYTKMLENY